MNVDGKTAVCGIIANPVGHSMSPLLQNLYGERSGLNFVYVPFKVKEGQVGDAVKGAYALNIKGINVTIPHKQTVMGYLVDIDETAKAIGAVNTLVRVDGGYKGYNTDALGLYQMIVEANIPLKGQDCIIIGAGGAAKAAAYLLAKEGAKEVFLLNRTIEKAEILADTINTLVGRRVIYPMKLEDYRALPKSSYFAIQTTSVGMSPNSDTAPIESKSFYQMIHTGIDLIYTPLETQFMKLVRHAGGNAINGLDMLVYQGVYAFELWNPGLVLDADTRQVARDSIRKALGNLG